MLTRGDANPDHRSRDRARARCPRHPAGRRFSALLDAGHGRVWAMPDNGFGNKTNSRSFLLRVYKVRPQWETRRGGCGRVEILDEITLHDPDFKVPFPIVNETTTDRL